MSAILDLKNRFKSIEQKLSKKPWFKKGQWILSVHEFPNSKSPLGVTFQVFKKHWWNEDRQGIHIESYLSLDLKKRKQSYVTIHLLHTPGIPGTKLKRMALTKPFVDAIYKEVSTWPGYKFRAGKYGTQPFTRFLDGTKESFELELEAEVTRLCTELGPVLEKCIESVS